MLSTNYILVQKGNVADIDLLSRNEKDIEDTCIQLSNILAVQTVINHLSCLLEQLLTIQAVCSAT